MLFMLMLGRLVNAAPFLFRRCRPVRYNCQDLLMQGLSTEKQFAGSRDIWNFRLIDVKMLVGEVAMIDQPFDLWIPKVLNIKYI